MRHIVLPAKGRDLSFFRLEGSADGSPVGAYWDGRILAVADGLAVRVALARAVDSVYHDAGLEVDGLGLSITASATLALLTLVEVCEDLTCVEFRTMTESKRLV
jgi:hypothetical protein